MWEVWDVARPDLPEFIPSQGQAWNFSNFLHIFENFPSQSQAWNFSNFLHIFEDFVFFIYCLNFLICENFRVFSEGNLKMDPPFPKIRILD